MVFVEDGDDGEDEGQGCGGGVGAAVGAAETRRQGAGRRGPRHGFGSWEGARRCRAGRRGAGGRPPLMTGEGGVPHGLDG